MTSFKREFKKIEILDGSRASFDLYLAHGIQMSPPQFENELLDHGALVPYGYYTDRPIEYFNEATGRYILKDEQSTFEEIQEYLDIRRSGDIESETLPRPGIYFTRLFGEELKYHEELDDSLSINFGSECYKNLPDTMGFIFHADQLLDLYKFDICAQTGKYLCSNPEKFFDKKSEMSDKSDLILHSNRVGLEGSYFYLAVTDYSGFHETLGDFIQSQDPMTARILESVIEHKFPIMIFSS